MQSVQDNNKLTVFIFLFLETNWQFNIVPFIYLFIYLFWEQCLL